MAQIGGSMANRFFDPGDQRAARVHDLFSSIALRYDLINDLQSFGLHRHWKRRVIQLARPEPGQRALDLCCGTGDLALGLARRGVEVVGVDFNECMLEVAETRSSGIRIQDPKALPQATSNTSALRSPVHPSQCFPPSASPRRRTGYGGRATEDAQHTSPALHFVLGDAQRIPFADNSFDIVTVGYGLRNLASWEMGLREMQRVAKPSGRLVVLDFGKPDNALWRGLYFGYLKLCVPCLGLIFCRSASAYAYILESLKHYPAQEGVGAKLRALGLVEVRVVNLLGGVMSINYGEKRRNGVTVNR